MPDGSILDVEQIQYPGCSSGFPRIEACPQMEKIMRKGRIGEAESTLLEAAPLVNLAAEILKGRPDFFLCSNPDCPCCPKRRELLKAYSLTP
jgi:hypothetical protein